MDRILEYINGNFIALPVDEVVANNTILNELLDTIIEKMKAKNPLFNNLFSKKVYGGSYWDGVKVTKPDEYDVHIQCRLNQIYEKRLEPSNEPGWVNLKCQRIANPDKNKNRRRRGYYGLPGLHCLINKEDYLDAEKVMLWFHQTLSSSLGGFKKGKKRLCTLDTKQHGTFKLVFWRHGPAFTFHAMGDVNGQPVDIHLDFVPCFVFPGSQYPSSGFLPNPTRKTEICIVSKPVENNNKSTRYWQISFQEQERELINGKQNLKPSLRLLKKMRDKFQHNCIASYFIKNIFLCQVFKEPSSFWNEPLSVVFMKVLKVYQEAIGKGIIRFFWYEKYNLILHVDPAVLDNVNRKLLKAIADFEKNPSKPKVVAKYFLTRRELRIFKQNYKANTN